MTIIEKFYQYIRDKKTNTNTKRSNKWPKTRKQHLKLNPGCASCGSTKKVEVHHIVPFHLDPSLELSPENLITLCRKGWYINCHLVIGHLGNFKNFNPLIVDTSSKMIDAVNMFHKIDNYTETTSNDS